MARQRSYGDILREARERKHLSLESVAHRLRIRADIVHAIEAADFATLPPSGYTRNMVSAYARLVNLSPGELTSLYLEEMQRFETGRSRSRERGSYAGGGAVAAGERRGRGGSSGTRSRSRAGGDAEPPTRGAAPRSRSDRAGARGQERSGGNAPSRGFSLPQFNLPVPNVGGRGRGQTAGGSGYPSVYSSRSGRSSGYSGGRSVPLPLLIGAIVLVLAAIVVLVIVFGGNGDKSSDIPDVPISGLTDTSSPEDEVQVSPEPIEPKSAVVEYRVEDGASIYAAITLDGEESQMMIDGPKTEVLEVTGKWSFATWVTDAVVVTVDGTPIAFDKTDETGMPMCEVDFAAILEQWRADHPPKEEPTKPEEGQPSE